MRLMSRLADYLTARYNRENQRVASNAAQEKQHLAAADKERALAEESKAKALATYVETLQKVIRNASIAYGFIVTFAYFFSAIHFFPSGLTIGDSVLFVFVAIGFGFASVAFALSGLVFWVPTLTEREATTGEGSDKRSKSVSPGFGSSISLSVVAIAGAWAIHSWGDKWQWLADHLTGVSIGWVIAFAGLSTWACGGPGKKGLSWDGWPMVLAHTLIVGAMFPLFILAWGDPIALFAACLAIAGVVLCFSLSTVDEIVRNRSVEDQQKNDTDKAEIATESEQADRDQRRRLRFAGAFALIAFLCPLILDYWFLQGRLNSVVLSSLGLRVEDATVRMSGPALESARTQRVINESALSFCEQPDGSALVSPVTLLWYGPGSHSLVALGPASAQFDRTQRDLMPRFEVAASDVQPTQTGARRCHDVEHNVLFPTNSAKAVMPNDASPMLEEVEHVAKAMYPAASTPDGKRWHIARVVVTGYADDMPLPDNGNETLARRRAACIAAEIVSRLQDSKLAPKAADIVSWEGRGSRELSKSCAPQSDKAQQVECNATNRRSRVRLIFECLGKDGMPNSTCPLGIKSDPPRAPAGAASYPNVSASPDNPAAIECLSGGQQAVPP